ncbi:MAG TPA: DUF2809 domain-containing protein, partial [Roseiflexaceae bacterium]|nr:DUF2809 domain-containing protein [Roseiflexaceae bacterium]
MILRAPPHCYLVALALVLVVGVASRVFHSGVALVDKYLGDALYAAMVYLLICLVWRGSTPIVRALLALALMLAIEAFQL